jgi:SSS family solute:Na+ symporter
MEVDTPVKLLENFAYETASFFWIINNIFFQYHSVLIFIACITVMIVVSYLTEEPSHERISGLTFSTMVTEDHAQSRASWSAGDIVSSAIFVMLIVAAYLYFTG